MLCGFVRLCVWVCGCVGVALVCCVVCMNCCVLRWCVVYVMCLCCIIVFVVCVLVLLLCYVCSGVWWCDMCYGVNVFVVVYCVAV